MIIQQLDRWLLNFLFRRQRIFKVRLADCCDEFGNSFGAGGSHFFVRALAQGKDAEAVSAHLRSYYAAHPIRSFNQVIGHEIADPAGNRYFCPWEPERIRPLTKFAVSHKAGPTSDEALVRIVGRLLGVLADIRTRGFRQFSILDGFPRVIAIVDHAGHQRYIMRDGQHRAAAISHLGYETLWVCYDADHWIPSLPYRLLARLAGNGSLSDGSPREVREDAVDDWPHVQAGRVTRDEALVYFHAVFGNTRVVAE